MVERTYEVAVAMVVEVSSVRVVIDTDAPGTTEEKLKYGAGKLIDVKAGEYGTERYVSHQYVDGVISYDIVD